VLCWSQFGLQALDHESSGLPLTRLIGECAKLPGEPEINQRAIALRNDWLAKALATQDYSGEGLAVAQEQGLPGAEFGDDDCGDPRGRDLKRPRAAGRAASDAIAAAAAEAQKPASRRRRTRSTQG
jgi:hypothetical protein